MRRRGLPIPSPSGQGLPVRHISFVGVSPERLAPLTGQLAQAEGEPLNRADLEKSLRQLFATGLFENIAAEGVPDGDGVDLVFRGTARSFIGTVSVDGAKGPTLNTQLESRQPTRPRHPLYSRQARPGAGADAHHACTERILRAGDYPYADSEPPGAAGRHCLSRGPRPAGASWHSIGNGRLRNEL